MTTPCENCPYRVDAPRRHWSKLEFESVLDGEADLIGKTFACHKQAALAPAARGLCAGWLLDQKKRNLPSIALRVLLMKYPDATAVLDAVHDGGHEMFRTVNAMCRANGVRPKRTPGRILGPQRRRTE